MRKLPLIIFVVFVFGAMLTGIGSYRATSCYITEDVQHALAMTMKEMPCDKVDADTIQCYRNYVTIDEVRDTACIAVKVVNDGERQQAELVAEPGCGFMTVLMMSDQRASAAWLVAGVLWLAGSAWYMKRKRVQTAGVPTKNGIAYGGLWYDTDQALFSSADGKAIKLTPMQQKLMEMFFLANNHTLTKQDICDRLWPKKPDASDTLYTLIRRLKQVIESKSSLKIESERGKTYRLVD